MLLMISKLDSLVIGSRGFRCYQEGFAWEWLATMWWTNASCPVTVVKGIEKTLLSSRICLVWHKMGIKRKKYYEAQLLANSIQNLYISFTSSIMLDGKRFVCCHHLF
ncbi:hypothetical protein NC652_018233 [Populus alba x Populus x berolinensis]|nr:hypothetical protein NC652_018233 [Populus alba x Populus x berolinensis]